MGYILPITQHTYKNYHYRMLESKNSPHYVGKPYKIILKRMQRDMHDSYKGHLQEKTVAEKKSEQRLQKRTTVKQQQEYYMEQQKQAELTGKGFIMNEQI